MWPKSVILFNMNRLAAALVLAGISASLAYGQEMSNVSGLQKGLAEIKFQALALKSEAKPAPSEPIEYHHHIGHHALSTVVEPMEAPDISAYPIHGMDVSHNEGTIQWDKIKAAGISFAFIKATEGDDYRDPDFTVNWKGASSVGVEIAKGAYHFYNFCKTGEDQAANFIKTVPREDGVLPMVIDLEESEDCEKMPAKPAFLKDLAAFVGKVKAAYGLTPILYVNLGIYDQYLSGAHAGYKLWIADPAHAAPHMPAGESWTFWQYSWHGSVDGIGTGPEVDLDVFSGDAQALAHIESRGI